MAHTSDERPETRALAGRARELTLPRFRLAVVTGPDRGREVESQGAELTVGTEQGNQLVLSDKTVSRHHFVITTTSAGHLLRDLNSTNGTSVAGIRVEGAFLAPGVVIAAGQTTLRYEPLAQPLCEPLSDEDRFGRALGKSPAMRRIFALLPRLAASESSLLIEGETGTGKSLLAEAIHQSSTRAKGPFVVLDCSSIPPTLVESELFGHEKGAFTGAHAARAGAFEVAKGGTLFLDEIGELPLDMQPKLLRALEERTIKRIGSQEPLRLDVRVIAATNRDLRLEVNKGSFRSDLFYRLNTVRLRVPPLRERREDIPLLVAHFYEQFVDGPDNEPPAELVATLTRQDWPGNVRELRSAVERAVLLGDPELWADVTIGYSGGAGDTPVAMPGVATTQELPRPAGAAEAAFELDPRLSFRAAKEKAMAEWERKFIAELVRQNGGNLSRAARAARMDRNHLRELLRRHQVAARDE